MTLSLLRADLARIAPPTLWSALRWYFVPKGDRFPYVVWLRVCQAVRRRRILKFLIGLPVYVIYKHYEFKYCIYGNANTEIGGGLRIMHGPCNLNAVKIGRNFTVYPGAVIGSNRGGAPTIGDNVSVFSNAVVCGPISIGDGAMIGALSYVSHDVAPGARVLGRQ